MDMSSINWLAVVVCIVVAMLSGFIWYHPSVFYKPWRRGIGKEGVEMGNPNPIIYVFTILAAFVEAVSVAFLLDAMGANSFASGLGAGFMLWLGFVAPTNLVNLMFFGAILAAWR